MISSSRCLAHRRVLSLARRTVLPSAALKSGGASFIPSSPISKGVVDRWGAGSEQRRYFFWFSTANPILDLAKNNHATVDFSNVTPKQLVNAAVQVQADYDQQQKLAQDNLKELSATELLGGLESLEAAPLTVQNLSILLFQMHAYDKSWIQAAQKCSTTIKLHHRESLAVLEALLSSRQQHADTANTGDTVLEQQLVNRYIQLYQKRGVQVEDRETWEVLRNAEEQLVAAFATPEDITQKAQGSTKEKLEHLYTLAAVKQKQAEMLGYPTYVEQAFHSRMVPRDHIDVLHNAVREWAQQAMTTMETTSNEKDVDLKDYISLDGTLPCLFALSNALFGIVISEDDKPQGWHLDVRLFHVKNKDGEHLGSFYLDPFRRQTKARATFMGPITSDIVYINTNIQPPVWDDLPTPVGIQDIVALFHEFGHVLQFLLADSKHRAGLGENDSTLDVSEIVPQFMEHWIFQESILQTLAHMSSGTKIPEDLVQQILTQRCRSKIEESLRRAFLGQLEFELFSPRNDGESLVALQRRLAEQYTPHDLLPKSDLSPMTQLVEANGTKAVAQYRYLLSEVVSADIFRAFQNADLANQDEMRRLGEKFEATLLKPGVLVDGKLALQEFFGRDSISTEAYFNMYKL